MLSNVIDSLLLSKPHHINCCCLFEYNFNVHKYGCTVEVYTCYMCLPFAFPVVKKEYTNN